MHCTSDSHLSIISIYLSIYLYSFLSLLRAEPISGAPVLLPMAMDKLLYAVRSGLIDAQLRTGDDDDGEC